MELGKRVTIDFLEIAKTDPDLLRVAAAEIVEAAIAEDIALPQFVGVNLISTAAELDPQPEANVRLEVSLFDTLSPEQQEKASSAITAMAEKFDRDEAAFSVVSFTDEQGRETHAVALTATEGIDLGDPSKNYDVKRSWNEITKKKNDAAFEVTVEGQKVDTRQPITGELLDAIAKTNPEINEWVWRTGEADKAGRRFAPNAGLYVGQVYLRKIVRSSSGRSIRFRPAVVI